MMRTWPGYLLIALVIVLVTGCGSPGEKGDPGPAGPQGPVGAPPPALTLITPSTAFNDRTLLAQLAGVGTHFDPSSSVRFDDPAIQVSRVSVQSSASLQLQIQVGAAAALAPHDVVVDTTSPASSDGASEHISLKGAFTVAASLRAEPTGNSKMVPQGGVADFNLRNVDRDNPLAGSPQLGGGLKALLLSALNNHLSGTGLIDALLPAGGLGFSASFDSGGQSLTYVLDRTDPNAPRVLARAATALTLGTSKDGERIAGPRQSNLYKLTTAADQQVLVLSFATTGALTTNTLTGALAPSSGRWSEGQFFYSSFNMTTQTALGLLPKGGDQYIAVLPGNLNGGMDYGYSVTARAATAKMVSTKEDPMHPDTPMAPLASVTLDAPSYSTDGAIDTPTDIDYLLIKTPKAGRLYVQVMTANLSLSSPATSVALAQQDCTTPLAATRPVQQEAAASANATYCAILLSPNSFVGPYRLVISQDL